MIINNPKVSIIIPTYNRKELLLQCLSAIQNQNFDRAAFEVIIIDDGSTDNTCQAVKNADFKMNLKYLTQENKGPASARNLGIDNSKGRFIAFTDDDCIPHPDWIKDMIASFPKGRNYAGLGGKIIRKNNKLIPCYIDCRGLMAHYAKNSPYDFVITANAIFRNSSLKKVRGFDEIAGHDWAGGEDIILSRRILKENYKLIDSDKPVILHSHPETLIGLFRMFYRYGRGQRMIERTEYRIENYIWLCRFMPVIYEFMFNSMNQSRKKDKNLYYELIFKLFDRVRFIAFLAGYMHQKNKEIKLGLSRV